MSATRPRLREHTGDASAPKGRLWLLMALVALATVAVYGQIVRHEFVSWDDDGHITQNPYLAPVTWGSLARFWSAPYFSHYVPLSYTFFSLEALLAAGPPDENALVTFNPAVFHAGSLLLHLTCALVVFGLLRTMLGNDSAATAGALVFALHPLQVESVAWISETRGLLAGVFSMLAAWQYLDFAGSTAKTPDDNASSGATAATSWRRRAHYLASAGCFLLALLAKPSAAALPLMLAALDVFWCRRRWWQSAIALGPWLAAAVAMAVITKQEQPTSILTYVTPLALRPLIAADALTFYLKKIVLPWDLCIHYPRRPQEIVSQPWLYAVWLLPATLGLVLWRVRGHGPWSTAAGWFVAALSPVLGLVPFAFQAYSTVADRYVYLAMFAPALLAAWCWSQHPLTRWPLAVSLCVLATLTYVQASHWRNNETLFPYTLTVNPDSSVGHNNWGVALIQRGRFAEALPHLETALRQDKTSAKARLNLGLVLQNLGKVEEAIAEYHIGLQDHPDNADVRSNLGTAYFTLGRYAEAIEQYQQALRLEPRSPFAHFNLALAYDRLGKTDQAIAQLNTLIEQHPVHYQGRMKLGTLLASQGQRRAALEQLRAAVERFPGKPEARLELALVLEADGQPREALHQYRLGMRDDSPHWHWLAGGAALLLATHPDASLRNGPEAVRLGEAACQRTAFQSPALLQALAAAYAEVGQFDRAAQVAELALSRCSGQASLEAELTSQLELYQQGKTWHKSTNATNSGARPRSGSTTDDR